MLRESHVLAFGRRSVLLLRGDAGDRVVHLLSTQAIEGVDPCLSCRHLAVCGASGGVGLDGRPVPDGCREAESWRAAEDAYRSAHAPMEG